ncbi:hypothetical protein AMTR_s00030p00232790 [Amborella trichopoda]|uniref:Uncharacterized protein n=1 Tax=Amborella trichopoda TaxID=13333 RepID=U5D172_AMBTC|nr:hypothetical protein AMTR_s00030p00232790 [Amborella trichopoda]
MFDVIGNGTGDIPTAFKSCFGHMPYSSDYGLVLMNQSQIEAIPTDAGGIWSAARHQLARRLASGTGTATRLLIIWKLKGGLDLSVAWSGVGTTGNGARILVFQASCSVTKVTSVFCLRTFSRALVAVGATSELSLRKCFRIRWF